MHHVGLSLYSPIYRLLPFHLSTTVSRFVADVPPSHQSSFLCYIRSSQASVQGGHVSNLHTVSLYGQWSSFCTILHLDYLLEEPDLPTIKILQVYGHQVCNGGFSSRSSLLRSDLVQRCGELSQIPTFWRDAATPTSLPGHTHKILTSVSPVCSVTFFNKTPSLAI